MNNENNNKPNGVGEEIKAAKVYKLTPENTPKAIPEREEKPWEKKKETPVVEEKKVEEKIVYKTKKSPMTTFFILLSVIMGIYIAYSTYTNKITIMRYNTMFTPVSTTGDIKELDINSDFVQDLYKKVVTTAREDAAEKEFNLDMKIYLAYKNIPVRELYKSNCKDFNDALIDPYKCNNNIEEFEPFAFKKEALKESFIKLFGEYEPFEYKNVQIGRDCLGGYEYIESRGEYVEGQCTNTKLFTTKETKKLVKATSQQSIIRIEEEVKYVSNEGQEIPEHLKDGTYVHVFELDKNYNYIYVNKYLKDGE